MARRQRNWDVAVRSLIAIKAFTCLWSYANTVPALRADTNLTQQTVPPRLTDTHVRLYAGAVLAVRIAHCLLAAYPSPPGPTLAALTVVFVILEKGVREILLATRHIIPEHPIFSAVELKYLDSVRAGLILLRV